MLKSIHSGSAERYAIWDSLENDGFISPPPVKPEGTIGLHSVCQSVCLSVSLSVRHTSFRTITDYVIHLLSWNFIHLLPMSQGCALLILGSKGQRSRSWIIDVWKWFPDHNWLCNPPMIMKLHTLAPHESRMCPIDFGVKKVKGQGHGLSMFENGFRTITDYVIHLWSWNFIHLLPMSQGCALLILGSKGQRSRSWIIDVWKWFPDHNWLCNPPMIMKLHTLAPHESRMCPIDFGVKRSKVKVMDYRCLKMVSGP